MMIGGKDGNNLAYKEGFNISSDETSADIEELSNDAQDATVRSRMNVNKGQIWDTTNDASFERERAELTETFENEKNDIVKGFILEKKILSREHEQEKQDLISNFVQERQKMLDIFQEQVKDIERKMSHTQQQQHTPKHECSVRSENVFDLTSEANNGHENKTPPTTGPGKLLIKLDGHKLMTPEQFLSAMELEERFESEKEVIEKSFRKEKHLLKDKLELDYAKKLSKEREKHQKELTHLHHEIDKLRNLKDEVAGMWKCQATQLESEFFKDRSSLERHHAEEKDNLRRRLEERNQTKLRTQQEEYDRTIRDLRNELRDIKKEVTKSEDHKATSQRPSLEMRKEFEAQLHLQYEKETLLLRNQNEKLNTEIQNLTTQKYELSRKLRELEHNKINEVNSLKSKTEKLNKENGEKVKRLVSQNDKLKMHIASIEKQNEELKTLVQTQESNTKGITGRLESSERAISQYEDMLTNLRRENSNLSHEINLLRLEKEELSSILSQHNEQERSIKIDLQLLQAEAVEAKKKYGLLEREKLKLEKVVNGLKKEIEKWESEHKKATVKLESFTRESERMRGLLEGERSENKRLHERFKTDAELLRKKDNENSTVRIQLENIKTQFESLKTRIESDNEKFCKIEAERLELRNQVEKLKSSENIINKHELIKLQKTYCKEFTKRLEYVKANYEREIFNLKEKIGELAHNNEDSRIEVVGRENLTVPRLPLHCKSCPGGHKKLQLHEEADQQIPNFNDLQKEPVYANVDRSLKPPSLPKVNSAMINEQSIRERLLIQKDNSQSQIKHAKSQDEGNGMENLYARMKHAEVSPVDNNELRNLLKDVRKEVLMLNKLIDEQTPDNSPGITPRLSPPTKENHQNDQLLEQMKEANQKTLDLEELLADKELEVNESKETMTRLYYENSELQRRLDQQQKEMTQQEHSCDELYKRRLMLEKLVDRLQSKLRDEASKRRRLEQVTNAIIEVSEEDLDESTV